MQTNPVYVYSEEALSGPYSQVTMNKFAAVQSHLVHASP